jgi:hypothetical protein
MTLTEFLLARIDEDEAMARDAAPHLVADRIPRASRDRIAPHLIRWVPARVLDECAAKRAIIGRALDLIASFGDWDAAEAIAAGGCGWAWEDVNRRERSQAHGTLDTLAANYADHPDYDEAWR